MKNDKGEAHRVRLAILKRDRFCTACPSGLRSVVVIEGTDGPRGVCAECHVLLTMPAAGKPAWPLQKT